ncbi:MAG: Crp/Fnr family transcriptional regulator [Confluentimicrobium sp.]|jgi:CRP-like cAMP-binding protein|uniref:Crp/Fnr family transcriptional regulator n=1 Tax=Actibacterium sp. TaxID=1872125 RepID=UPI00050EE970|nr:Crp/Fnr family transcriptional regulator [Actibacterium sp.]KGB81117.1 cyclic nucleotide-binding protein [Rhodovulum sp. NI22]MBC58217.1 Crp/Fnr family transcriptional regulator [Actibacterium sp.]MDY6859331.1 Crp/Fnr family transcriptional regulator [Pseudomonadota bacterium]|tara:strand:- start:1010 stop:1726 length:717 start_codon:yes stop_codon:yes gene_type:complete
MIESEGPGAIYLSEYLLELNEGAGFLSGLNREDLAKVRKSGTRSVVAKGDGLFFQGDPHTGVWVVESGRIRTFYTGPSGREITLAYWTPGHFVGGPEVFGRGRHIWSADALDDSELLFLSGMSIRTLVREIPDVAVSVIQGLIAKGKCYSALIQMLGTRSVAERLEQFLVILADTHGRHENGVILIDRAITYEQLASIVGATRQWVTQSLDRLQREGVLKISRKEIAIYHIERLSESE